jgi:hypothetical protein
MDTAGLERRSECEWWIAPRGKMRVPAVIYATESLIEDMDEKVREQITNVATLPGIVKAAYCMPDAHWGYGFPIGGRLRRQPWRRHFGRRRWLRRLLRRSDALYGLEGC